MEKCHKVAALYIASLKAMVIIHQNSHWTVKGNDFYGNHLLFERIYNSAQENLDLAAEKFVGLFGVDCLDYKLQCSLLNKILAKYNDLEGAPAEMSLAIERDFIKLCQEALTCFEDEGELTLGLDDTISQISNKREESVYLLQQSLT